MQSRVCKEPEEAAISQSSCNGWVGEQVCSSSSQGLRMSLSDHAGVTQLPITWCHMEIHRELSLTGHIRPPRKWGVAVGEESQAAPRGCQGLSDRAGGERLPSQQLFPFTPGHPTHHFSHLQQQPGFMWHMRKGEYFSNGGPEKKAGNKLLLERKLAGRSQTGSKSS